MAAELARAPRGRRERALLARIAALCDEVEARWDEVEAACAALPAVLVHGDLKRKNLRLRRRGERRELVVLDWELAGWGSPVPDLEWLSPDRAGHAAAEALARAYLHHAGWTHVAPAELARLAWYGAVMRMAAGIEWASRSLGLADEPRALRLLADYAARLAVLRAGPPGRGGSA